MILSISHSEDKAENLLQNHHLHVVILFYDQTTYFHEEMER